MLCYVVPWYRRPLWHQAPRGCRRRRSTRGRVSTTATSMAVRSLAVGDGVSTWDVARHQIERHRSHIAVRRGCRASPDRTSQESHSRASWMSRVVIVAWSRTIPSETQVSVALYSEDIEDSVTIGATVSSKTQRAFTLAEGICFIFFG
jgi:hypothetical protein